MYVPPVVVCCKPIALPATSKSWTPVEAALSPLSLLPFPLLSMNAFTVMLATDWKPKFSPLTPLDPTVAEYPY